MKKDGIIKNYLFQFIYQILVLFIPLITSPYLTRILGETALGNYTYINSFAYYFLLFAMLGILKYGQRLISSNSNDIDVLKNKFWELYVLHAILAVFSIIIYFCVVIIINDYNYMNIYLIEGLYVLSALFDVTWLFYGLEDFKSIIKRNLLIKIAQCFLIFIFVKNKTDLWKYTLINSMGILLGQILLLCKAIKILPPVKVNLKNVFLHFKPLLVLFISILASTLYTVFDKTLLGILSTKENVAFYEYSDRIIAVPRMIIGVIGTVMFPRACKMVKDSNYKQTEKYIDYSILITCFFGFATIFGLLAVADDFSVLYYGESFSICGKIMKIMSPIVLIVGIGDIARMQFLIPNNKDKIYTISIVLNAIINLVVSFLCIPKYGIFGAVFGTILAELFGCVFQLIASKKVLKFKMILKSALPCFINGLIMYLIIFFINKSFNFNKLFVVFEIFIGAIIYVILFIVYIFLFRSDLKNIIVGKIKSFRKK